MHLKYGTTSSSLIPEILKKIKIDEIRKKLGGTGLIFLSLVMNLFQRGGHSTHLFKELSTFEFIDFLPPLISKQKLMKDGLIFKVAGMTTALAEG